jgi:hypothetical protein
MRNGIAGTSVTAAQIISMASSALAVSSVLIRRVRLEGIAGLVAFGRVGNPLDHHVSPPFASASSSAARRDVLMLSAPAIRMTVDHFGSDRARSMRV